MKDRPARREFRESQELVGRGLALVLVFLLAFALAFGDGLRIVVDSRRPAELLAALRPGVRS